VDAAYPKSAGRRRLSVRQVQRLYRAFCHNGAAALISKKRGRRCNRRSKGEGAQGATFLVTLPIQQASTIFDDLRHLFDDHRRSGTRRQRFSVFPAAGPRHAD
jgi:hypothetical protein